MKDNEINPIEQELNIDQLLTLMAIYEHEWEERDNILWKQTFKFFYLSILIMIIPNISEYAHFTIPPISTRLFPIAGIIASTIALYLSLGYAKRLEASSDTYQHLINQLPERYRRVRLKTIPFGKLFTKRLTTLIPFILYAIIILIGIILLIKT